MTDVLYTRLTSRAIVTAMVPICLGPTLAIWLRDPLVCLAVYHSSELRGRSLTLKERFTETSSAPLL